MTIPAHRLAFGDDILGTGPGPDKGRGCRENEWALTMKVTVREPISPVSSSKVRA